MRDLSKLSNTDLNQYGRFIDYMLIRVDESELDYWEREAEALNIETLGRQAIAALKRLPYGLTITR
jgi:hypothetical protein